MAESRRRRQTADEQPTTPDAGTTDAPAPDVDPAATTDEAARQAAVAAETDAQPPVRTPVYGADTATVAPKRYAEPGWQAGRDAPSTVVRVYDAAGQLGEPEQRELAPGERGVIVVGKGQPITRAVRAGLTV